MSGTWQQVPEQTIEQQVGNRQPPRLRPNAASPRQRPPAKARRRRSAYPISRRSRELPQGLLVPLLCEAPVVPEFVLVPPVVPVVPLVEPAPVVPLGCEPPLFIPAPPCEEPAVLERLEDEEVSELLPVPPEPVPLSFDPLHPARKPAVITAKTSCFIILPYSPSPSLTASGDRINGEPT